MKTTNSIINHCISADSYKFSQFKQYRKNTENIFSYIEFRGSDKFDKSVFFGLNMFLQEYMSKPITKQDINFAEEFITAHGEPFNREGWEYILKHYDGYLPLRIKAAPEGSVIPLHNVLVTVENTDPNCYWLTSFKETTILPAVWYPSTVATVSYHVKKICKQFLDETSDNPNSIDFMLNDFGYRGVSSFESAGIGGCAHLACFKGTDNVMGVLYARKYYEEQMAGYSIPAMEHSTICSWERNGEKYSFQNMIAQYAKPNATFACVIDSYDTYGAIQNYWLDGGLLKKVKEFGARCVLRPDSGDPTVVPVKVLEMLIEGLKDECTVNSKGYTVLPNYVRVIQGDGVNLGSIKAILQNLKDRKISAENIVFGMGGKLLQADVHRDSLEAAMKCSSTTVGGKQIDVYKHPITDSKKNSKKGRLTLVKENGLYKTIREEELNSNQEEVLQVVYENGILINAPTLEEVRNRINEELEN